jgi:hypothetical protein
MGSREELDGFFARQREQSPFHVCHATKVSRMLGRDQGRKSRKPTVSAACQRLSHQRP